MRFLEQKQFFFLTVNIKSIHLYMKKKLTISELLKRVKIAGKKRLRTTSSFAKAGVQARMILGAEQNHLLSSRLRLDPRLREAATTLSASGGQRVRTTRRKIENYSLRKLHTTTNKNWRDWTTFYPYGNCNFAPKVFEVCETIQKIYISKRSIE
jgi:hypothetical protein